MARGVDLLISASPPSGTDATCSRLPRHPPSWLGAASHTCFHYRRPQQPISHTWPHHCLLGRPSANDAPVCQRPARPNVARVVRVSVAPRARRVPRSRFHHQQMGVVFQLPVTDLQSLDELEKSLQQSCIISLRLKAIGSTGWATLQKWNGC
jgi:hypothetical protein